METTREEGDPRSPKRQARTAAQAHISAASAVAALDDAIWINIIEFLPMPKKIELTNEDGGEVEWDTRIHHYNATVSDIVATWTTLLNLRLVSKELAVLLHPTDNAALWRRLVLQGFDFSADGGDDFNVDNFHQDCGAWEEPEEDTEQNPLDVALRGRRQEVPDVYLEEDLQSWPKLGIFHRPSQYRFLRTLQQQPPVGVWPESEDALSLFGDLVCLLQLPHAEMVEASDEWSDTTIKYLAAPTESDSSWAFFDMYLMKTLGYVPHFWHWGHSISGEWRGFTDPESFEASINGQLVDKGGANTSGRGFEDGDHDAGLPNCCVGDAKILYQRIREHCRDWRSVCCNEGSDGYTPVFFVGESKASPHRWIGYAGQKCWS